MIIFYIFKLQQQKIEVHIKAGIQLALFNVTESIFFRVSFIFSSYFRCIFLTSLKLKCKRVNPVGIEQFFHVTQTIFLRFFLSTSPTKSSKPFVLTASHQKTDLSFVSSHLHDFQQAAIKSFSREEPFTTSLCLFPPT